MPAPSMTDRRIARQLARESLDRGDPVGWFEKLYQRGETDPSVVPWVGDRANPHLVSWGRARVPPGPGRRALVVGCGYGYDAEWLSELGFAVTAFDISPTAISAARRRGARSKVEYVVANALETPSDWHRAFDLVFEGYTLQVLPVAARVQALENIAATVRETLLIIARGREETEPTGELPWPLTRRELARVTGVRPDLVERSFEDFEDDELPPVRRFRAEFGAR
jgi:SAM-dependent methyltransferase